MELELTGIICLPQHNLLTKPLWALSIVRTHLPDFKSQILIDLSSEQDSKCEPEGWNIIDLTQLWWPSKVNIQTLLDKSHNLINLSLEAVAINLLTSLLSLLNDNWQSWWIDEIADKGAQATDSMTWSWPNNSFWTSSLCKFITIVDLSLDVLAIRLLSCDILIHFIQFECGCRVFVQYPEFKSQNFIELSLDADIRLLLGW